METSKTKKVIDKLIYVFIIIFLLSLTNSIFVNQIGYYGALLLILIRYFLTRENQFSKSGLELAFIWFIIAEIISFSLSVNQADALHNLMKRVLLMPVVYVMLAGVTDFKTGKNFFYIYLAASLVTSVIYIYFIYKAFQNELYGLESVGGSFFQYPITASEIISFSVVFIFAFLINEKVNWKYRIVIFISLLISVISLVGTFKRTGWLGALFGIFIILLIKKEWKILIPGAILLLVLIIMQKDLSEVRIFEHKNDSEITLLHSFNTDGRATHIYPEENKFIISDYENGLVFYEDTSVISKINLPAPVVAFDKWIEDYFIASLIDSRFILLKRGKDNLLSVTDEFITPGYTVNWIISHDNLYVLDSDSGLTIFRNPENLSDMLHFPELKGYSRVFADSGFVVLYAPEKKIKILEFKENNNLVSVYDSSFNEVITSVLFLDGKLLLSNNRLKLFEFKSGSLVLIDSTEEVKGVYTWYRAGDKLFALGVPANFYELNIDDKINIKSKIPLDYLPGSIAYSDSTIFLTKVERSKINSIWDPYIPSNFTRLALWRVGWEIFKDYPIFGVGDISIGDYQKVYKKYYEKEMHGHLHNNFVHILACLGLFGLLAVCFMLIKMYKINFRIYRKNKNEKFLSSYSLGAIGALSAFIFSGLTELNIWDHEIITLVYFTFALNVALSKSKEKELVKDTEI